ncbi:MAG: hypothetical protein QXH92_04100 [Candidatus Aenigmatarchaeota archaeon]
MLTTGKILNRIPKTYDMYYVYLLNSKTVRPAKALMNTFCFAGDTVLVYVDKTYNMGFIIGVLQSPILKKLNYQIPTTVETHAPFFTTYSTFYSDVSAHVGIDKLRNCYKISLSTRGFPLTFAINTKAPGSIFNYIITSNNKIYLSTRNLNISLPVLGPPEGTTTSLLLDCSFTLPSSSSYTTGDFVIVCIEPIVVTFDYKRLIDKINAIPATNTYPPNIELIIPPNTDIIMQSILNSTVIPAVKALARDLHEIGISIPPQLKIRHVANISLSGTIMMLYEDGTVKKL